MGWNELVKLTHRLVWKYPSTSMVINSNMVRSRCRIDWDVVDEHSKYERCSDAMMTYRLCLLILGEPLVRPNEDGNILILAQQC